MSGLLVLPGVLLLLLYSTLTFLVNSFAQGCLRCLRDLCVVKIGGIEMALYSTLWM